MDEGSDMAAWESCDEGESKGTWRSSILIVVGTLWVAGGERGAEAIMVGVFIVWVKKESKVCSIPMV